MRTLYRIIWIQENKIIEVGFRTWKKAEQALRFWFLHHRITQAERSEYKIEAYRE